MCLPPVWFGTFLTIFPPLGDRDHAATVGVTGATCPGAAAEREAVVSVASGAAGYPGGGPVRRLSSGTTWEPVVGYSRAVAAGDFAYVSGCTSVDGAEVVHRGDAYAQTAQAISSAAAGLAGLGASLSDVVQTRMYVTDISRWREYGRAHGEAFGEVRPVATMVQVAALIEHEMLVEIEVVAYRPGVGRI